MMYDVDARVEMHRRVEQYKSTAAIRFAYESTLRDGLFDILRGREPTPPRTALIKREVLAPRHPRTLELAAIGAGLFSIGYTVVSLLSL